MHLHIFQEINKVSIKTKVDFIHRYRTEHSLKLLLWAMQLAKSSYYEYIYRKQSRQAENMEKRRELVAKIFIEYQGVYGARKINSILNKQGVNVCTRTVSNDMKALHLHSCYVKKYRPKCKSNSQASLINYLKSVETTKPKQNIVSDITYIHTQQDGWVYALTFMDHYTRKVLHFDVSRSMDSAFVDTNLLKLIVRYPSIELIHTDRGSQFTSFSYQATLSKHSIIASYSAKGYPYDNARIESYHAALKIEKVYRMSIKNCQEAFRVLFEYNYGFYNSRRIHQSLNYLTPNEFESLHYAS